MKKLNYQEMIYKTFQMYPKGEYQEAYDLITNNQDIEDGCLPVILYLRFAYACLLKNKELSLKIFKEAVVDFGLWFPFNVLMADKDYSFLYEEQTFKELAEICRKREAEMVKNAKPELIIVEPKDGYKDGSKAIIFIQGNDPMNLSRKVYRDFQDLLEQKIYYDHLIAYPISILKDYSGVQMWNSIKKGAREVQEHHKKLIKQYKLNAEDIIICAGSAGAEIALEVIAGGLIKVKKMTLIMPFISNIDEITKRLSVFKENDVDVYIIAGDEDKVSYDASVEFAKSLDEFGIKNKLQILKDAKHEFQENYEKLLLEAKHYHEK